MGITHDVCQDYALSGTNKIVVADGCSGSQLSDIGSRVLSITAINKIAQIDDLHQFDASECILLARPSAKMLDLPDTCLDATLLGAAGWENCLQAFCYGDGTIAIKTKNGDIVVIDVAYTDSHPFYINYLHDRTGRHPYWLKHHNQKKITLSIIRENGEVQSIEDDCSGITRISANGGIGIGIVRIFPYKTIVDIVQDNIDKASESISWIAIMSDGVHSFYEPIITETSKQNKPISYFEILKELLTFKNYKGKFVQRRLNRFIKNCDKKNWHNADDVSLAAIYCGG